MVVTIADVANRAGVSTATVSYVLNEKNKETPNVSPETRQKVLSAIEELGYIPNRTAKRLRTKEAESIGIILIEPPKSYFKDPLISGIVSGAAEMAREEDRTLLLYSIDRSAEEVVQLYRENRIDGAIVIGGTVEEECISLLEETNLPLVVVASVTRKENACMINADYRQEVELLLRYLREVGHNHIGFISGGLDVLSGKERYLGFVENMKAMGCRSEDMPVFYGDWTECSGMKGAAFLTENYSNLTAIVCANDMMAIGCIKVLTQNGYIVPQDMSVVGIDNVDLSSYVQPPLTTVQGWNTLEIGRLAVKNLVSIFKCGQPLERKIITEPRIVIRDSVCPPKYAKKS